MIQGGDPTGTGMGGPGYRFQDETKGSPHKFDKPGKLAMANSGPGTNGCQFFITVAPTPWLTGNHTIFGEVVEGQDIVTKISLVPRNGQDKPHKPVVLESVVDRARRLTQRTSVTSLKFIQDDCHRDELARIFALTASKDLRFGCTTYATNF